MNYLVVIEHTGKNYCAAIPDVPGCVSAGETVEETLHHMKEALEGHLADSISYPDAHTLEWHLKNGFQLQEDQILAHVEISKQVLV
jgi:predicted RNase H-like HicB family nuclease